MEKEYVLNPTQKKLLDNVGDKFILVTARRKSREPFWFTKKVDENIANLKLFLIKDRINL